MLTVGVLGPLELRAADGRVVRVGSSRQRRLLAALALHANAAVADDVLAELVWGDEQPVDPTGAVHTNVARLRRVLPAGVDIVTEPHAYRLAADADAVDAVRFTAQLAMAEQRVGTERLGLLDAALALWRGRPYAELDDPMVTPTVGRLVELHASAEEGRADLLLSGGRPNEAVAELEALTTREPLRESAVALLMRALCAVDRQSDALRVYTRLRQTLAEELGIDPSPTLRRLEEQVLRQQVDSLRPSSPPGDHGLPVSSFIGRGRELRRVVALLGRQRVVTVTGPGGVGKTRLARHAVHAVTSRYADGVIWVELGPLRDSNDVPAALATELRLSVPAGEAVVDRIAEVLAVRQQLIVFDNCEHLADAVAALLERIASATAGVDVLLTSREPLRVDGEHIVVLAPLADSDAVELLVDRIRAVTPDNTIADTDADVVADIASRLDGLPLALELAAARVHGFGLRGLRNALDEPFDVLTQTRRTATDRHRSLVDVVDWSYRLLNEPQRELFVRLGVFVGPVEHDAVAAVCAPDTPVAATLADLVDRSLVTIHDGDPTTYGMLDTLRAFARRQLASSPDADDLRHRHADWAVALAEDVLAGELTPAQAHARSRFDAHLSDLRRAHAWLRDHRRIDELLRLTLVFAHHAYHRLRLDLVQLVDDTLLAVEGIDQPQGVRLLGVAANFGWQRGDLTTARRRGQQALTLAAVIGDDRATAPAREALGDVLAFRGDLDGARTEIELARNLAGATGDRYTEALALCDLGLVASYSGDDETAAAHNDALDTLASAVGAPSIRGWAAYLRGERHAQHTPDAAVADLTLAVELAEEVDDRFLAGVARHTLITTAARTDSAAGALTSFAPLIDHWHTSGAWTQLWITIRALIDVLSRDGHHHDVALLLGAYAASARATPLFGFDAQRLDNAANAARAALADSFDATHAEGAALGDDGAIAAARTLTRPTTSKT